MDIKYFMLLNNMVAIHCNTPKCLIARGVEINEEAYKHEKKLISAGQKKRIGGKKCFSI